MNGPKPDHYGPRDDQRVHVTCERTGWVINDLFGLVVLHLVFNYSSWFSIFRPFANEGKPAILAGRRA